MPNQVRQESAAPRGRSSNGVRLIVLVGMLALLGVSQALWWATRGAMAELAFVHSPPAASMVDLRLVHTAQALASLAATAEEQEYAREAEHLANYEVEQAFSEALRAAQLEARRKALTGQGLALSQEAAGLQRKIAEDRVIVERLRMRSSGNAAAAQSLSEAGPESDRLRMAEAQLGLDSDRLTDVQGELDRATNSLTGRIRKEEAAYESAVQRYENRQVRSSPTAVVLAESHRALIGRLKFWLSQRSRYHSIQQAQQEALEDARQLMARHDALQERVKAMADAVTLDQIQDRRMERQILAIENDRIDTERQLADVYARWDEQVRLQHQIGLHLILQSVQLILLIGLCMFVGTGILRRLKASSHDHKHMATLYSVFRGTTQVAGILLIALVVFGAPHQTGTMIGLATAALTLALQDYILAFIGWFMLLGKNGIHAGDMVEIDGVCGEVLEVGLMKTTLLETSGLAEKGEPTGRRISFLNSFAVRGKCFNFSSDGQWLWDEITVSVPADGNIEEIARSLEAAAREETAESARQAQREWDRNARATGLTRLSADPIVMMRPSGPTIDMATGVDLQVRYVTRALGRFEVRDRLYRHVIRLLQQRRRHPAAKTAEAEEGKETVRST